MRRLVMIVEAIVLGLACMSLCHAGPISNGDFETGSLSPWAIVFPTGPSVDTGALPSDVIDISSAAAHAGTYGVRIVYGNWGIGVVGMISQTVATVPGQSYSLSYWLRMTDNASGADLAAVAWGTPGCDFVPAVATNTQSGPCSVVPGSWILNQSFDWTQLTFTVTATESSMAIALAGRSDYSAVMFDDVSLTPQVPEPATLWLGGAVLLAGLLLRFRARRASS